MGLDFQTYVFLDLEATGLPLDRPRVTEISLVAVSRFSLENVSQEPSGGQPILPRVLDKLTFCVNPQKVVSYAAADLTGLSNEKLVENGRTTFDPSAVALLKAFLGRQAGPKCLIAHCGLQYDFPLLKTELLRQGADLDPQTYCVDSLLGLRDLGKLPASARPGQKRPRAYNLASVYLGLYGKPPEVSHTAEDDVLTLIRVFLAKCPGILEWSQENARRWEDVKPMYAPSPRKTPPPEAGGGSRMSREQPLTFD